MKRCDICITHHESSVATCPHCGEASWSDGSPAADVTSIPVSLSRRERKAADRAARATPAQVSMEPESDSANASTAPATDDAQ